MTPPRRWDLFCRVIDNFGDVGVCWRLAADLAARGQTVRLWIDDASALAWLAPRGAAGVTVVDGLGRVDGTGPTGPAGEPGDVVVEAFGCDLPAAFVERMAAVRPPPLWLDLEYLSAEPYVERCHGLRSPQQHGPGAGLDKWFFYPGFGPGTGGLIRERDLLERQRRFDAAAWLASRRSERRTDDDILVSLFCYDASTLPALGSAWRDRPVTWLVTAAADATVELDVGERPVGWRVVRLPWLRQTDYDHLLWACDLNFVRGEDSFVRAQWAARPFVWQAYRQTDGAHIAKVDAFLDRFLEVAEPATVSSMRPVWAAWNGMAAPRAALPERQALAAWGRTAVDWRERLLQQADLASQLIDFLPVAR